MDIKNSESKNSEEYNYTHLIKKYVHDIRNFK